MQRPKIMYLRYFNPLCIQFELKGYLECHSIFFHFFSVLRSLVHKKKRLFQGANDNGINPDWADGYRISGLTNNNNDDQFSRHTPM